VSAVCLSMTVHKRNHACVIVLEVLCSQLFMQLDLKPAASTGSQLLEEPGDPGLEVEIHVVLMEDGPHAKVLLCGDHKAPFVCLGKEVELRPQVCSVREFDIDRRMAHFNPSPPSILHPPEHTQSAARPEHAVRCLLNAVVLNGTVGTLLPLFTHAS
jgi:hypothetical protein